jgi:hypothetical protein
LTGRLLGKVRLLEPNDVVFNAVAARKFRLIVTA